MESFQDTEKQIQVTKSTRHQFCSSKAVRTWRAIKSFSSCPNPKRAIIQSSMCGGTWQCLKLYWGAKVRCLFEKEKTSILRHCRKRQAIFYDGEISLLLPHDYWLYSTIIIGIKKMEAWKVYQWLQVHLRETIKTLAHLNADRRRVRQKPHL